MTPSLNRVIDGTSNTILIAEDAGRPKFYNALVTRAGGEVVTDY